MIKHLFYQPEQSTSGPGGETSLKEFKEQALPDALREFGVDPEEEKAKAVEHMEGLTQGC